MFMLAGSKELLNLLTM